MRFGCQFMLAGVLVLVLGLGACSTTPSGDGDPTTRTVCERVSGPTGSRMGRRVCREEKVEQPSDDNAEGSGDDEKS